jgi:hypothetical protein
VTEKKDEDDRHHALAWYLRKLLLQEQERGVKPAFIAKQIGWNKTQISHIMTDARSAGPKALFRLAKYFRRTEGELLDQALEWWERQGRREAAEEMLRRAQENKAKVDQAIRKNPSGERPSVRLRAGLPIEPPTAKRK